jgi:hypothetical protein
MQRQDQIIKRVVFPTAVHSNESSPLSTNRPKHLGMLSKQKSQFILSSTQNSERKHFSKQQSFRNPRLKAKSQFGGGLNALNIS